MIRTIIAKLFLAIAAVIGSVHPSHAEPKPSVWFSPGGETPDLLDLFYKPEQWTGARSHVSVFKFGPNRIDSINTPKRNSLADLIAADAFGKLRSWGISLAIEAPAIKGWDCIGQKAAAVTLKYVRDLRAANGAVRFIAMDEPLVSGIDLCHQTIEEVAGNTAAYRTSILADRGVQSASPPVEIGDIEAYPSHGVDQLEAWTKLLVKNGFKPSFFHLDVDVSNVDKRPNLDWAGDLRELTRFFHAEKIPFGVIFWSGHDPESSDQAYYDHAISWIKRVHEVIGKPEQSVFQSWVLRSSRSCFSKVFCNAKNPRCSAGDPDYCGLHSVPVNLPEEGDNVFSHTRLIDDSLAILDGN